MKGEQGKASIPLQSLRCRVGSRKATVELCEGELVVLVQDVDQAQTFLLDGSLRIEEKFAKDSVSILLMQGERKCQLRRLSRRSYQAIQAFLGQSDEEPTPAQEGAGTVRLEPVALTPETIWEEMAGSAEGRRIQMVGREPTVTVYRGADQERAYATDGEDVSPFREARSGITFLCWILTGALLLLVVHGLWIGSDRRSEQGLFARARAGDARAVSELIGSLRRSNDLASRVAIVEALSVSGGPAVKQALAQSLLVRDEPYYRRMGVQTLVRLRVGKEILAILSGSVPRQQKLRLVADLGRYGSPQLIPVLQTAYANVDPNLRLPIVKALAQLGNHLFLVQYAAESDRDRADWAMTVIESLPVHDARALMSRVMNEAARADVQSRARRWLGRNR